MASIHQMFGHQGRNVFTIARKPRQKYIINEWAVPICSHLGNRVNCRMPRSERNRRSRLLWHLYSVLEVFFIYSTLNLTFFTLHSSDSFTWKTIPRIKQRVASYHTTEVIAHRKAKSGCRCRVSAISAFCWPTTQTPLHNQLPNRYRLHIASF